MSSQPSAAEQAVRDLDTLRKEYDRLHGYMRNLRLGRTPHITREPEQVRIRRISWLPDIYGGGWIKGKAEPMPGGMSSEFYRYLADKADAVGKRIHAAEAALNAVEVPR